MVGHLPCGTAISAATAQNGSLLPAETPVRLLLHGGEAETRGGPSLRVPRTAQALRDLGWTATASIHAPHEEIAEDIVHLFNVWPPDSALETLRQLRHQGKTVVFSPIYLDLSEMPFWAGELPHLPLGDTGLIANRTEAARRHFRGRGRCHEALPGHHAMLREMLDLADHVIFLSHGERDALARLGAEVSDDRASLVRNPVDAACWEGGDPEPFRTAWLQDRPGPEDYILCIGRIEERKNQLLLARAVRDLPVRLVLIGHDGSESYARKVRAEGGPSLVMTGRLEHGGEMMRSALAGARAFVLPSWAEGASLAALEAAAAGTDLVLSDHPSEREYFGDRARYCDPGDPDSIRRAVAGILDSPAGHGAALARHVACTHDWPGYARATAGAYGRAVAACHRAPASRAMASGGRPGEVLAAGGAAPSSALHFDTGWHPPESQGRRLASQRATFRLAAGPSLRPGLDRLEMLLRLSPPTWPDGHSHRLTIRSRQVTLFDTDITATGMPEEVLISVPPTAMDTDAMIPIEIALPPSGDQGAIGTESHGTDGPGLISVTILDPDLSNPLHLLQHSERWSEGQAPVEMDFSLEMHRAAAAPDLAFAPAWGLGTTGPCLRLFLPLLPGVAAGTIDIGLRPVATATAPSGAVFRWNGRHLAERTWTDSPPRRIGLRLEASDLAASAPAVLEIELRSRRTPAELGLGSCTALAGLGVSDLIFTPHGRVP